MSDPRLAAPRPGRPWPLGVSFGDDGVNLAVVSVHAEAVELCLFEAFGTRETARLRLPERTGDVHHGFFAGLRPGQVYGLRAHGPWAPGQGHRFNSNKLLLDPYARGLVGSFAWTGPNLVDRGQPFAFDPRDSATFVPKGVMLAPGPPAARSGPAVPWDRTLLYELHVKGMTKLHPAVPEAQRGTYQGLAHPAVLEHLVRLGVTTVELMPVMAFLDEHHLAKKSLVNYWGYNPYNFFVPEARYAATADPLAEFAGLVAALHGAGLEIILDVVFNHTAETDELGPTLSFRGLDNALYYRLRSDDRHFYVNDTGTGNTLDTSRAPVVQLVMDSMRFWAALGVDGFRFDLAPVLGRGRDGGFDPEAPLLQAMRQDPMLGGLKLIAEPWDIGFGGYRLGQFPPPFAEWNDRFRDCVRRFWRGDEAVLPELAGRILGSAELFEASGRKSFAGINFIAAHDGFTALDTVTYAERHNAANGEGNRDGHGENFSAHHGVEGPCDDPAIQALRQRQVRNLLATLLLAQGTPMLAMGDELGRSQGGNNNAYCQDNPTSWLDWAQIDVAGLALSRFVRRLTHLRGEHTVLRSAAFLHGRAGAAAGGPDVRWLTPDGRPMAAADWQDPAARRLVLVLDGRVIDPAGQCLTLLLNADPAAGQIRLPEIPGEGGSWTCLLDTAMAGEPADDQLHPGTALWLEGRSLRLYCRKPVRR